MILNERWGLLSAQQSALPTLWPLTGKRAEVWTSSPAHWSLPRTWADHTASPGLSQSEVLPALLVTPPCGGVTIK